MLNLRIESDSTRIEVLMKRKIVRIGFLFILLAILFLGAVDTKEVKEEVLSYQQEVNQDGIAVDMSQNPYFNQKQPGYYYPEPEEIEYASEVTGTMRHAYVILPPNYSTQKTYPVLYLLHGLGGSHKTWLNKDADIILYNLMYFYGAKEMIIVLPNSEVTETENADDLEIREKVAVYDKIEEDLVYNLMPFINSHYSVKTGKENTAIAGNSMGGRESAKIAFHHPELFNYIGLFSSAGILPTGSHQTIMTPVVEEADMIAAADEFELIFLCVGREDEVCGFVTYDLHERMEANGIRHIFYDTEGGHQNTVWQNALYNFGKRIFQ